VHEEFDAYTEAFRGAARRAARDFEARDWASVRREATARLDLYAQHIERASTSITARRGNASADRALWSAMRQSYAGYVQGRPDQEIAETFFNSVMRRHLNTVGVDRRVEFLRTWAEAPARETNAAAGVERRWCSGADGAIALASAVLDVIPHPKADQRDDARRVGAVIAGAARDAWGDDYFDGADVLTTLFYRNKGAYLVGAIRRGDRQLPLVLALLSTGAGVVVDAALTSADEASVVFGFAWSYFSVDTPRASAMVAFLHEIMPLKRVDELYTAIGHNKHGKTELYRTLSHQLAQPDARFEDAEGTRGLVMAVFTLPSLNIVLKIIKDVISAPKRTTRQYVMEQYHRVFHLDRVGRLADAQLFQGLEFRRECFSDTLLADLLRVAPSAVQCPGDGDRVVVRHLYTERRVRPLNLYLQEVDATAAERAILDYGQAIKDLAAANIFPGDLLLKNFGVTRHGRVIFYDYDELATLDECRFRHLPVPRSLDDELAAEPWFSITDADVFPGEFLPFLVPAGALRDAFVAAHGDLLDPDWWRGVQSRHQAGELDDTFPYPQERRLRVGGSRERSGDLPAP
jgi:isocitrate dehydrogenase kinase/phosphatase